MKFLAVSITAILLAGCAGPSTSGHGGYRFDGASGGGYNRDVHDAVMRGTTQGINPL